MRVIMLMRAASLLAGKTHGAGVVMSKARLESFSDGVFAFAITLLVLTIAEPDNYSDLGHQLASRWPSLIAFMVSFAVIGIMWLNHHTVFRHFERIDRGVVYLNMLLLMTITFLPYPTGVLGHALAEHQGSQTAAVLYAVVTAVNAWAWGGLWWYGSYRGRLLAPSFPAPERAKATLMFTIGVAMYTLAIGVAFLNAYAFLILEALFGLYYAVDPLTRRPRRPRAGDATAAGGAPGGDGGAAPA